MKPKSSNIYRSLAWQSALWASASIIGGAFLYACSLSEEIKHIEASKEYEQRQQASRSTDLTGEQIFIRSCNTCHPGGKEGLGPSLAVLNEKYADDMALKLLIRKGKGIMPGQPSNVINDGELDRLIIYLRTLRN